MVALKQRLQGRPENLGSLTYLTLVLETGKVISIKLLQLSIIVVFAPWCPALIVTNASPEIKIEGVDVEAKLHGVSITKVLPVSLPGISVIYVVSFNEATKWVL